ncbi:hypothetical protein D9758_014570 [Tetrapyrgos nigripes]|uniref:FCP1 homology domain-containing protein n=1 Tax=Tetrapyrgos nigripes TaxID=182062 RepID=A0A8H5CEX9_9AGAR|nr:hypothetical protein D9758_014570 [Tetrapyrgos nigripes]
MARGRNPNTNHNRNSRRKHEQGDINDDNEDDLDPYSDAYGSGYNYNPRTSALSVQSSYTSMAFYMPPDGSGRMVDPYGDEFNEGWSYYTTGSEGGEGEGSGSALNGPGPSFLGKHFSYSQPQPVPSGSASGPSYSSRYDPHFRAHSPPPASPSPSYKTISSQPSTRLEHPSEARKLLILDLNGTLVYRAPRGREIYTKTQTTKDLDKPWEKLTPLIPGNEFLTEMKKQMEAEASTDADAERRSRSRSNNDANAHAAPLAPNADAMHPTPYTHSPLTTLLLDDSPLKARLQPYNHFCVPEYSRDVWARDGRVVTSFMSFGIEGGEDSVADAVPGTAIDMGGKSAEGSEEREREREEGRGVEATEGPTETETEIPIDEDAITEDVVANTSTDSIATLYPTPLLLLSS